MSEHGPTAQGARAAIDPWVFFIAAAHLRWRSSCGGCSTPTAVGAVADDVLTWIIATFGWVFVIVDGGLPRLRDRASPSAASGRSGSARTTTGPSSAPSPGSR